MLPLALNATKMANQPDDSAKFTSRPIHARPESKRFGGMIIKDRTSAKFVWVLPSAGKMSITLRRQSLFRGALVKDMGMVAIRLAARRPLSLTFSSRWSHL